jgi:hypothetical protein
MKKTLLILTFTMLGLVNSGVAQKGETRKCETTVKGGKYKVNSSSPSSGKRGLMLSIVVKPKNFNREYMLQVAQRIKSEYCSEKEIIAVIFDDRKLDNLGALPGDFPEPKDIEKVRRGYYSLDKAKSEEGIEFSTKRGNPTTEVEIDLTKEP